RRRRHAGIVEAAPAAGHHAQMGKEFGHERCATEWLRGKTIEASSKIVAHHGGNGLMHGREILHDNRTYRCAGTGPCELDFFHGISVSNAHVAPAALGDKHRSSAAR